MEGDNTFHSCRTAGIPPLPQRSYTLEIHNQKLQLSQASSENSAHSEKVRARSQDSKKKKHNCYFLPEPLRCMSVTSSRFCLQQGQNLEEWETQMRLLSHLYKFVSFIEPPTITRVTIQITGPRNAVYLEVHPLLLRYDRWNQCFTLMDGNIATDCHKGKVWCSVPRIYRDHWCIRYREWQTSEEMQTSLLDTGRSAPHLPLNSTPRKPSPIRQHKYSLSLTDPATWRKSLEHHEHIRKAIALKKNHRSTSHRTFSEVRLDINGQEGTILP